MFKRGKIKIIAVAIVAVIAGLLIIRPEPSSKMAVAGGVPLPVIMYHSVLREEARGGTYVVSPQTIEKDFAYLQERGYSFVSVAQILDYVQNGAALPPKPVFITFDDGYYNNFEYLPEILQKYKANALISVVGEYTQKFTETKDPNPNYGHMSWDEVKKIDESEYVEIGNHSYMLHHQEPRRGASRKKGESAEAYKAALSADTLRMQQGLKVNCGIEPTVYTYPYGQISEGSDDIMRELGFDMTLSCYERVTMLTRNPDCLLSVGRYNRPSGQSTAAFMAKLGIN